jgi:hypothetical protein
VDFPALVGTTSIVVDSGTKKAGCRPERNVTGRPEWATRGLGTLRDGPGRFLGHSYGTKAHTASKLENQNKQKFLFN